MNKQMLFLMMIGLMSKNDYASKILIKDPIKKAIVMEQDVKTELDKENGDQVVPADAFATNTLLIFLDNSEEGWGPIAQMFAQAVQQKAGPILVSFYTFFNVFGRSTLSFWAAHEQKLIDNGELKVDDASALAIKKQYDLVQETFKKLVSTKKNDDEKTKQVIIDQLNKEIPQFKTESVDAEVYFGQHIERIGFNRDEWIIKEIEKDLVLLVPKNMPLLNTYSPQATMLKADDPLTPLELAWGLKIDHMESIEGNEYNDLWPHPDISTQNNINYFIDGLDAIFVRREEYTKKNISVSGMPQWALYITGHGRLNKTIVNLPIAQFKSFLDFLEKKIVTKLLVYSSCYAVGANMAAVYKEIKQASEPKDYLYSYPIALEGSSDSETQSISMSMKFNDFAVRDFDFNLKKMMIVPYLHFDMFVQTVIQNNMLDYDRLLSYVLQISKLVGDIPQIRLPNLPWFAVLDVNNKIVSIGSVLAKARTKPLSPRDLFNAQKKKRDAQLEGILLYTPVVPFDLIIDTERMPKIISMLPGTAIHYLKKVIITNNKLELMDFFKAFYLNALDASNKIVQADKEFWIDELEIALGDVKGIDKPSKKVVIHNVMVKCFVHYRGTVEAYFTINDQKYRYDSNFSDQVRNTSENYVAEHKPDVQAVIKQFEQERLGIQRIGELQEEHAYLQNIEKMHVKGLLDALDNAQTLARQPITHDAKKQKENATAACNMVRRIIHEANAMPSARQYLVKLLPGMKDLNSQAAALLKQLNETQDSQVIDRLYKQVMPLLDEAIKFAQEVKKLLDIQSPADVAQWRAEYAKRQVHKKEVTKPKSDVKKDN